MNGNSSWCAKYLNIFRKICLGSLATEFQMFIGAELLLYYQPANTATQNIKILVLTQSFLGGTVLGLANLPLVWIRKNCLAVQTPYTTREDIDVSIWISNSFLHFKQMNFRKNGTYVSDKKAGKKKISTIRRAGSVSVGEALWESQNLPSHDQP